jgi:hypothetical protein
MIVRISNLAKRTSVCVLLLIFATMQCACVQRTLPADLRHECTYMGGRNPLTGKAFDPETATRPSPEPIVKILEFTDDGEVVDRCQWSDVLYEIQSNKDLPKLVIFYVHGWKHDASQGDDDLQNFTKFIGTLTRDEHTANKARSVIGVYVAWPGKSTDLPGIENLTFWSRKGAADRVSEASNFTKFISASNSIRCKRNNPDDFIVGIGHSFGARILFSSISPLLIYNLQMSHPGRRFSPYKPTVGPIDLTILLNPAFEASRYTAIDASRRLQETFSAEQEPLLLTISTTNDDATKIAFPIGQIIGSRTHIRERTTLGNYSPYFTHSLGANAFPVPNARFNGRWYDHFCTDSLCLERNDLDIQPGNPFLVATTGKSVLNGHSGIWNEPFAGWLVHFIENVDLRERRTGMLRGGCGE